MGVAWRGGGGADSGRRGRGEGPDTFVRRGGRGEGPRGGHGAESREVVPVVAHKSGDEVAAEGAQVGRIIQGEFIGSGGTGNVEVIQVGEFEAASVSG